MVDKKYVQDYTAVCRTCLQSNIEMLGLDTIISCDIKNENDEITYMDCLKLCIEVQEPLDVELPRNICLDCASVLSVSYWFIKNASQAQELLKMKLLDIKRKKHQIEMDSIAQSEVKKTKRFRCKICNVKVETKRSLKDHIKLHLDIIVYNCQLCSFESPNRGILGHHYMQNHGVEATKEQMKPKTKLTAIVGKDCLDGATTNEHFQILPDYAQTTLSEKLVNPTITSSSCVADDIHGTTIVTATNPNYTTISTPYNPLGAEIGSVANEFIVLSDGTLEKVMNKGVVIEYINTPNNANKITSENGLALNNIVQVQNVQNTVLLDPQNEIGNMDVDDLIIEDRCDVVEEPQGSVILPFEEEKIPATIIPQQPKKIMCKICTKDFLTQEQLKNHMLTHNEIPHFFCDQCNFYTFFKIDLHQHYKSKHNMQPTYRQLQPKNKQKNVNECYACDLCFYESDAKSDLKTHYKMKHNIQTNEIHLKPITAERYKSKLSMMSAKAKASAIVSKTTTAPTLRTRSTEDSTPDYPNGLNCRKCNDVFYWRSKLYEHYKMHNAEEAAVKQEKQLIKVQNKKISPNLNQNKTVSPKTCLHEKEKNDPNQLEETKSSLYHNIGTLGINVPAPQISTFNSIAPLTPSSSSTYTLPSDAIPQIVETDQTIDHDMDFYFNCDDDVLFADFDDDVDVENNSDDNEFGNVLLTSDDDFEEMLQNQNDNNLSAVTNATESYCAHCQKSFLSQYQFENHMFIHRGLAPYRCELCTNLYNTKRCLIRHYRAVHKKVPTRDMIQAKGDKACDDKTSQEDLKLEQTTCYMCPICPYESGELNNIKFHLECAHNINDGSYIMKKLPFECPRCIRSFNCKIKVLTHLERNHSLIPINHQQVRFDSATNKSGSVTSASTTSITDTVNNVLNTIKTECGKAEASCGKIYKVNTSASTTKFLTKNPIETTNINNNNKKNMNNS